MSAEPVILPAAEAEMARVGQQLCRVWQGLDRELFRDIGQAIRFAAERRQALPEPLPGVRRVRLRRYPYALYVTEAGNRLAVLALLPDPRPTRWWRYAPTGPDVPPAEGE